MLERSIPAMAELPPSAVKELRDVKERNLRELEENLELLRESVERRGGELYMVENAEEARRKIIEICRENNVKLVVKAKSMTSEEIELTKALEAEGITVMETDLGERIIQLAGEKPVHILGPALHKTKEDIARLFTEKLGKSVEPNAESILETVREDLREKFLSADMTITGANAIVAENAAVVLVTNEGNDRLSLAFTPIYLVVAGVEKIVRSVADALKIVYVLPRSATGQRLSSYVTFQSIEGFAYPRRGGRKRRKVYFVIIDNGRMKAREDPELAEALYCIRCSACLNTCPTYNMVGGHVFGYIYSGPMSVPWTLITHGLDKTEFAQLCLTCGLCREVCPLEINLPYIASVAKHRYGERYGYPEINQMMARYERFASLGSAAAGIVNLALKSSKIREILENVIGVDRRRPLPSFRRKHLGKLFKEGGSGEAGKVALFTDSLIYYSYPEIGLAAARLLMELGFYVVLPPQRSSGMPLIQYGFFEKAREVAEYNIESFYPLVEEGYIILSVEPTAEYCLRDPYIRLLGSREARAVAEHSYNFFEFLMKLDWDRVSRVLEHPKGLHVFYHLPCHSRTLDGSIPVKEMLERLGVKVSHKNLGCCGMAGTWGMKRNGHGYDLSIAIGRQLASEYEKTGAEMIVTESTVCALQFKHLSRLPVKHPLELVYPRGFATR